MKTSASVPYSSSMPPINPFLEIPEPEPSAPSVSVPVAPTTTTSSLDEQQKLLEREQKALE